MFVYAAADESDEADAVWEPIDKEGMPIDPDHSGFINAAGEEIPTPQPKNKKARAQADAD